MAQIAELSLVEAHNLAEQNYPLLKKTPLLEQLHEASLDVFSKKRAPTLELNSVGQLQTENISIGEEIPDNPNAISLPLETFNTYLSFNYNILDGGLTKAQKESEISQYEINRQQLNVDLRKVKDQVNSLFIGILLLRQQELILATSRKDLESTLEILNASFQNGTILESEVSKIKVRQLELESESEALAEEIMANLSTLSKLIGQEVTTETSLFLPEVGEYIDTELDITRPEQNLFEAHKSYLEAQKTRIKSSNSPTLSLFAQGGVGYPNPLNFPDISTATYALGGLRLRWNLFNWGANKKEKIKIDLQRAQVEIDKETFEFEIDNQRGKFINSLQALNKQIEKDYQIVNLQESITEQSEIQLREGVIKSNDYILEVNAELKAKQQLELHLLQKRKLQIDYLTLFGKL